MVSNLPSGTVTFLFTDIEGSTKLAQEHRDTWEASLKQHNNILRNAIEMHKGYVFRIIGDAFCAAFHSPGDALRAALKSQVALKAFDWQGSQIKVRMGIHTGQAEIQENGDYEGYLTLTCVQRVMSAAYGGQILLSNPAAELVRNELPENASLLDLREHRLKGLPRPEQLWQVIAAGLPKDFPPLPTLNTIPNNLPVQLTSFIGREKEVKAIKHELSNHRLITLTGPGGIGKTRLSVEAAADLVNDFPQGVWFVELEQITEPALIPASIAQVFNINETAGRKSIDALKDYLRDKELLLILDNFEQVVEAATQVKDLLLAARNLRVIVTSRMPLRIAGEYEYRVPLLPLPGNVKSLVPDQLAQLESVQLFVERAQSAKTEFLLTAENAPAIAEICLRLDGLPLALELAAARVRVLPPRKMLDQLDNSLKFLKSSARDLPVRQQTLHAAIRWSYDLLPASEQLLFPRLAVFWGGATLEAIEYVCNPGNNLDLLTEMESLLEKNLIGHVEQDGEARYEMLGTIRDFADEILAASGEANQIQARNLNYFHRLASLAEPKLVGPDELRWLKRLTVELSNLRSAILWGIQHDLEKAVEMMFDLTPFWSRGGYNDEVIGWLHLALSKPELAEPKVEPTQYLNLRAKTLLTLAILSLQQGLSESESIFRESIVLFRQLGERTNLAVALAYIGFLGDIEASLESVTIARTLSNKWIQTYCLAWQSQALQLAGGDLQLARRSAAESAELAREIGSVWALARSIFCQGELAVALGQLDEAREYLQECLTLYAQSQDRHHENMARTELAHVERWQGNFIKALQLYKLALVGWQDLGLQAAVARQFECLAMIAATQQKTQYAARLSGAANKLRNQTGSQLRPNEKVEYNANLEAIHSQLGTQLFKSCLSEGQDMTTPEAIAYALALSESPAMEDQ